jgi:hypothetical protein
MTVGRRLLGTSDAHVTNSLYASWDDIFYPDGVGAWMARIDATPKPEA